MWEKGKAINISVSGGAETEMNWARLSRQTGRDDKALERWHDLRKNKALKRLLNDDFNYINS